MRYMSVHPSVSDNRMGPVFPEDKVSLYLHYSEGFGHVFECRVCKNGGRKHESKNRNADDLLLAALMLMSAMFVPAASAAVVPEVSVDKISERLPPSPWETDHTNKVTHETMYLYTYGTLEVTEVYSGNEFQKNSASRISHEREHLRLTRIPLSP